MAGPQEELFTGKGAPPDGTVAVNARCLVRTQDGHRVVLVAAIVLCQYSVGDHMAEAHAMVSLVEQGWAEQNDVARAFGCSSRTVRRFQRRFEAGGLPALSRAAGYPAGRSRLSPSRSRAVSRLKAGGHSNREIARRLGVNEKAIRKLVARLGWRAPRAEQARLPLLEPAADPNLSAAPTSRAAPASEPLPAPAAAADPNLSAAAPADDCPTSFDTDPADRCLDRLFARLGELDAPGEVPRTGPVSGLFGQAFLVTLGNPKAIFFFSALFPQFIDERTLTTARASFMLASVLAITFACMMTYATLGGRIRTLLARRRARRVINGAFGLSFIGWEPGSRSTGAEPEPRITPT